MSSSDIRLISFDTQVCIDRLKHRFFVFWHFICVPPLQGRFHLKVREQINGISPVGVNFLITITIATDGTCGTNISQKIDLI